MLRVRSRAVAVAVRRRLESEANARLLAVTAGGSVLIAEFNPRLRDAVAHWPQVQLVGGVHFSGRKIHRIRVDRHGQPVPVAPVAR